MTFAPTALPGVLLIGFDRVGDERGWFVRVYDEDAFAARGLCVAYPHHAEARNARRGTIRGLHWQSEPHAETKVIRCVRGTAFLTFWSTSGPARQPTGSGPASSYRRKSRAACTCRPGLRTDTKRSPTIRNSTTCSPNGMRPARRAASRTTAPSSASRGRSRRSKFPSAIARYRRSLRVDRKVRRSP